LATPVAPDFPQVAADLAEVEEGGGEQSETSERSNAASFESVAAELTFLNESQVQELRVMFENGEVAINDELGLFERVSDASILVPNRDFEGINWVKHNLAMNSSIGYDLRIYSDQSLKVELLPNVPQERLAALSQMIALFEQEYGTNLREKPLLLIITSNLDDSGERLRMNEDVFNVVNGTGIGVLYGPERKYNAIIQYIPESDFDEADSDQDHAKYLNRMITAAMLDGLELLNARIVNNAESQQQEPLNIMRTTQGGLDSPAGAEENFDLLSSLYNETSESNPYWTESIFTVRR
jgi:hypothetical protein